MTLSSLRSLALGTLFFSTMRLVAQDAPDPEMQTLFGSSKDMYHSGWGAPTAAYTTVMDQSAMLVGLRGGWLIDHRLTIGIAGYGLVTPVENTAYDAHLITNGDVLLGNSRFQAGYGGLFIEPVIGYTKAVHFTIPIIIGAGGCGYSAERLFDEDWDDEFDPYTYHDDYQGYFVAEAGVGLELSVVKMVRLNLSGSYRYTSDINLPETPKDAFNGFNAALSLKVGVF
jgi:hypothetical protein